MRVKGLQAGAMRVSVRVVRDRLRNVTRWLPPVTNVAAGPCATGSRPGRAAPGRVTFVATGHGASRRAALRGAKYGFVNGSAAFVTTCGVRPGQGRDSVTVRGTGPHAIEVPGTVPLMVTAEIRNAIAAYAAGEIDRWTFLAILTETDNGKDAN